MKEKIMEMFKTLGFELKLFEGYGYVFQYEGSSFLWSPIDGDDAFLNIAIPGVMDRQEGDESTFYQIIDKLNSSVKYVKVYSVADCVWLLYERELFEDDEENLERIITHMIYHLDSALAMIRKGIRESANMDIQPSDDAE